MINSPHVYFTAKYILPIHIAIATMCITQVLKFFPIHTNCLVNQAGGLNSTDAVMCDKVTNRLIAHKVILCSIVVNIPAYRIGGQGFIH